MKERKFFCFDKQIQILIFLLEFLKFLLTIMLTFGGSLWVDGHFCLMPEDAYDVT
jgi:hypothetical protein